MSDVRCHTCGADLLDRTHTLGCNPINQMRDLVSFGYSHGAGAYRSGGDPFVMLRPTGEPVYEQDFGAEIDRLLARVSA